MFWVSMQDHELATSLIQLFQQLDQEALQHSQETVDPTALREVLSRLPGSNFQIGQYSCQVLCCSYTRKSLQSNLFTCLCLFQAMKPTSSNISESRITQCSMFM